MAKPHQLCGLQKAVSKCIRGGYTAISKLNRKRGIERMIQWREEKLSEEGGKRKIMGKEGKEIV